MNSPCSREAAQRLVDRTNQALGFYAIAASIDVRGMVNIAVAAQNTGGVYLSSTGGWYGPQRDSTGHTNHLIT